MIHAKSESDLSVPSSPRSPKRPVYYVQSPSHDGDKSSTMHHTPSYTSPMESPSHPSYARPSLASSASRVSGPYSRPTTAKPTRFASTSKREYCQVIDDEEDGGDHSHVAELRRCQVLIGLVGSAAVFCVFCVVIWCASRPFKPQIDIKSLSVHSFYYGQGSDLTGVPSKILTVNCTMRMSVYNPATFFGIYVSSVPVNLMYSELVVATGQLINHYQPRKSHRIAAVNLRGTKVPLYGAGASLASTDDRVPLKLVFQVRSQGNVVGKLVKSRHNWRFACSLLVDSHRNEHIKFKSNSCGHD